MRLSQGFIHLAVGFTFSLIQNFHTPALAQPRLEATGHSATAASESFEPPQAARNPLRLPQVGNHELRILTPTLLELFLVTTKAPDPARVTEWDFVDEKFKLRLPAATEFAVEVNGAKVDVESVGFRRRVIYAPLKQRDLRIGNALFLELTRPIPEGAEVEVFNPGGRLWGRRQSFQAVLNPQRWTPAIHVNHVGYHPDLPKRAMIGYFIGSLGEMKLPPTASTSGFKLIDVPSGEERFSGKLKLRRDVGFTFPCYQNVVEADFTEFKTPGEYRLLVPGIGVSFPFFIHEGVVACFAKTYALGLYQQRCGASIGLPFSRFGHRPCHVAPAEVPTKQNETVNHFLKEMSSNAADDKRHTAPPLRHVDASLYPFVNVGRIDVAGGHHDAGDYSKYTINSAQLIHHLVFAADAFPNAGALDNLGLPESGDGRSDLLQEAKWEADFLVKMQDKDGGFYFLVYPRNRAYEDDVLPDPGDPQVVFPKTTSVTAAAVAALAQTASSPLFKKQFPAEAARYLAKAKLGWAFLEKAIARHGRDGAYQKITHYGNEFRHEDELIWAATELFLATGDPKFAKEFLGLFDPEDRETKRWTWWRMFEAYGCAIRSYAFGAQTGRIKPDQLDAAYLAKCRSEIRAAAQDQVRFARESAYGTSFPDPSKRFRTAGWYFSLDRAFDIAVAASLDLPEVKLTQGEWLDAMVSNLNYEGGCNPVNVCYLTGLGWNRPRDIVHQYGQNDRRALPPSGIPIGNVQAGFQYLHHYQKELGALSFPPDGAEEAPYPFYDRWGDSFNVTTEFVVVNQARGLGTLAWLMGQTPVKSIPEKPFKATIVGISDRVSSGGVLDLRLNANGRDLKSARVVWEGRDLQPTIGEQVKYRATNPGRHWIEVEAHWADGQRAIAIAEFSVNSP
jgi:hypothetical protein